MTVIKEATKVKAVVKKNADKSKVVKPKAKAKAAPEEAPKTKSNYAPG